MFFCFKAAKKQAIEGATFASGAAKKKKKRLGQEDCSAR